MTEVNLASTERFRVSVDQDIEPIEGIITLCLWDITVGLTGDELDELVGVLTEAQAEVRKLSLTAPKGSG